QGASGESRIRRRRCWPFALFPMVRPWTELPRQDVHFSGTCTVVRWPSRTPDRPNVRHLLVRQTDCDHPAHTLDERSRFSSKVRGHARLGFPVDKREELLRHRRRSGTTSLEGVVCFGATLQVDERLVEQCRHREADLYQRVIPRQSSSVTNRIKLAPGEKDLG